MKKYFTITYKPINFKEALDPEYLITFLVVQCGLIIYALLENIFKEDLLTCILIVSIPTIIYLPFLIIFYLISKAKIIFDYKNMRFIKQNIFTKKIYDLNEIQIEKNISNKGNNEIIMIIVKNNGKILAKINALSFEANTGYKINSVLE